MYKKFSAQALELTQYILEQYWQSNQEPLRAHISKNIMWIGSMDEEYLYGEAEVLKRLDENNAAMPPVFLDEQEYGVVQNEGRTCVVAGRYRAYTKPESGMLLSEKQRVTFVWEKCRVNGVDELKIMHLHLSNILHMQSEDERFPTRAGKENYDYIQKILAERSQNQVISVKDENLVNKIINYSDIMYLKSEGNYIRLFMGNHQDNIRVRGNLSDFIKRLPEDFIQASRSFGVNRSYVQAVQGRELSMIDGAVFKIPAAGCNKVKAAISKR